MTAPGTGPAVGPQLRCDGTSSGPPHTGHWGQRRVLIISIFLFYVNMIIGQISNSDLTC